MRTFTIALAIGCCIAIAGRAAAETGEPYSAMLQQLRADITARLPKIDDTSRQRVQEANGTPARIEVIKQLPTLEAFLASDVLDAKLAKFVILHEATPAGLVAFAQQGPEQKELIDTLLSDEQLMLQMVIADGARPIHGSGSQAANYGRAMEIYTAIQNTSSKAKAGVYQRLALAVSLEDSESDEDTPVNPAAAPDFLQRYLHYEKAYDAGELDPNFDRLSVWELRFVVCAPESDEALAWGRKMLRNFRPDHILTENEGWRYANVVNTDVQYGSIRVKNDRPELMGVQNILMNGGICGRRAFFARYICRAFGIPATARPSSGHGASARWSPEGWVVVLGPQWGSGRTTTRYRDDLAFVATTQARTRGKDFLKVKRAYWIGDVMGEPRSYEEDGKSKSFWNGVALSTQQRIIDESKAVTLDSLGAEFGEANGVTIATKLAASAITPEDRKITYNKDGTIIIPAAACTQTDSETQDVIPMTSFGGGRQVFLPRYLNQKPILVRGGSWRHEAALCASATRHWRGRRPRNSRDLRGLRLVMMPDDGEDVLKEIVVDLGEGVKMEFVYIPPGSFTMGGAREEKDGDILADTPRHEVTLTQGFYLGKYEVTRAQYQRIMSPENNEPVKDPTHPADGVKPFNGVLIGENLAALTGLEVRLPTEAEWEYAARAGTDTTYYFGDDPAKLDEHAWFQDNADGKPHPVGQKKPNPWGLYDMYGNVAEFVRDEHQEDYYAQSPKVDPTGPLLGIHSSMKVIVTVPEAGRYTLSAQVVTANPDQFLKVEVNEHKDTMIMPLTLGEWGESQAVTITLKQGDNTLHFWRDGTEQAGMAVKSFTLKPANGE